MNTRSGFICMVGRPNVGKSTLLNKLIGQKVAIVSDKPQTTRNRIQGIYTCEEGQAIFIDTPGIHKPKHLLGEYMVNVTARTLREVDLIFYVVDATSRPGPGEEYIVQQLMDIETPIFLILNKIDLVSKSQIKEAAVLYNTKMSFVEKIPVSAATGQNLPNLKNKIFEYLPEGPFYYPDDEFTDQPERFIVAETIREKALSLTREEVPHCLAVEIDEFKEKSENMIYIRATIFTERESQKGIVIGRNGTLLRQIGELARKDIEKLLGTRVYLDLWVKVKNDWRNNEIQLRRLGYDR
ncbi:MAG: GTPase Era [Chitinophagales bacterium]